MSLTITAPPWGGWSHTTVTLSSTQATRRSVVDFSLLHDSSLSSNCVVPSIEAVQRSTSSKTRDANEGKRRGYPPPMGRIQSPNINSMFGKGLLLWRTFFRSKKARGVVLLNLVTFIYASEIAVLKVVESVIDPAMFTVVRFASSVIPLAPYMIKARHDIVTRNSGLELGLWVSLGYITQALGMLTSDAGRASFLSMFTVILVPLLDGMLGAFVPITIWIAAFLLIIGVGMLECSGSPPCVGDILNFFSAVFFGIHMIRTEHISRRTEKKKLLPVLGYEFLVVALSSTAWFIVESSTGGAQDSTALSWTWVMIFESMVQFPWIPAIYTGVMATGLCLWVEMVAMRDVSATETAIIYGLEPIWGAGFAWFLLGERWGVTGWIGAALILVGSVTVQMYGSSSPTKSTEIMRKKNDVLKIQNEEGRLSALRKASQSYWRSENATPFSQSSFFQLLPQSSHKHSYKLVMRGIILLVRLMKSYWRLANRVLN